MPLQIDRARNVPGAVDLRPAVRASGLFGPNLDEPKFRLQLGIMHNLVAQRFATLCYDLDHRLHFTPTFSRKSLALQCLFNKELMECAGTAKRRRRFFRNSTSVWQYDISRCSQKRRPQKAFGVAAAVQI